jgi:fumarate reductase flavoprotein subunit
MVNIRGQIPMNEIIKTQIVVIGSGGGGLATAVAAAETGADVIVIEKRSEIGGNSVSAHALFAVESQFQKQNNITLTKDEVFKEAMRFARWSINPRLIRAFIDKSADTIEWLENKGIRFTQMMGNTGHMPFGFGPEIVTTLNKKLSESGVRVLCDIEAKEIVTDEKKRVVGVKAVTADGEYIYIEAKSAVIATGGYGGNNSLLKKYCPYYSENNILTGLPNNGDGLIMATEIGAATDGLGILNSVAGGRVREENHGGSLMNVAREPFTVWVNNRGERFLDENFIYEANHFECVGAVARQPQCIYYAIIDEKMKQNLIQNGIIKGFHYPPGTKMLNLSEELQSGEILGAVKISESLDGIAEWIGANHKVFTNNIDGYNSFCDKGHDDLFSKTSDYLVPLRTPPYYAIKCGIHFMGTIGGIKINHKMEVVNDNDMPIPGLYTVGVDAGGWASETNNGYLAGAMLGFAINSGRIAGENASRYISLSF